LPISSVFPAMKPKYALQLAALAVFSSLTGLAQDPDHSWSRTYPVTGKPTLTLETSDAGVEFRPCGDCHEIRIHIEVVGRKLTDYRLEEGQSGDEVHFLFKELPHMGGHIVWHREQTRVTVESPAQLTLQARTSDGNVTLSGLQGDLGLTTGDGNVTLDHVSGNLRIQSGDGQVKITNAEGAIDAHTSDGSLSVDGLFHALALHTSDGTLDLSLREGTKLAGASTIQSSDGSVTIRVPQNFAADLNVHTSDGHVDCALPLTMDHYQSGGDRGNQLRGKLNGGGAPLTIHTSDGNVKIEYL
jgi:Putative adhesin